MRPGAIIAAILAAVTLAACGPSLETANHDARTFCATHGGTHKVEYYAENWPFKNEYDAECKDGSTIK